VPVAPSGPAPALGAFCRVGLQIKAAPHAVTIQWNLYLTGVTDPMPAEPVRKSLMDDLPRVKASP